MLTNPYNPGGHSEDLLKIAGRVSPEDFFYFKKLFPIGTGMQDKIISNLFKKLIDELRRRNLDPTTDAAWSVYHPNYLLLTRLLDGVTFPDDGEPDGGNASLDTSSL